MEDYANVFVDNLESLAQFCGVVLLEKVIDSCKRRGRAGGKVRERRPLQFVEVEVVVVWWLLQGF